MRVEYVEPFLQSAFHVLSETAGLRAERGPLSLRKGKTLTAHQLSIVIGVNGTVEGVAVYGMSLATAQKIVGAMLERPVAAFDDAAGAAISDMANMISGGAMDGLTAAGCDCKPAPASTIRGIGVEITTITPVLVLGVRTDVGKIEVSLALSEVGG